MINFEKFTLANGLRVIVHPDKSTPIVAVNILYDVGARDESPDKTGFAHLFEHLMFGGSVNIPKYDEPLQKVGGENNAFTNNDITNYYLTVPKQNLETAFWLESDRMLNLAFSPKSLETQRNVVIEEFKQVFLNQPYGDAWLLLRPLAYKLHPYKWATIGKEMAHIENAKMEDVKAFYQKFYNPVNAIMVVAGDVETKEINKLSEKWFGDIPSGEPHLRNLPMEPSQKKARKQVVERKVPVDSIFRAYHMCSRNNPEFYITDLVSDILSNGESSRFQQELIKKQRLFSEVDAFVTGDIDTGLFIISGKLMDGIKMEEAEKGIDEQIEQLQSKLVAVDELRKVQNKIESSLIFSEVNILNKAMNLAFSELLGDASLINEEAKKYLAVTPEQLKIKANDIFRKENCSSLYYHAGK